MSLKEKLQSLFNLITMWVINRLKNFLDAEDLKKRLVERAMLETEAMISKRIQAEINNKLKKSPPERLTDGFDKNKELSECIEVIKILTLPEDTDIDVDYKTDLLYNYLHSKKHFVGNYHTISGLKELTLRVLLEEVLLGK